MHEAPGSGLTFAVVTEQLADAAREVRAVTQLARVGALEELPAGLTLGHETLTRALYDFCARWDRGLSALVGDSDAMAQALEATAADYEAREDDTELRYRGRLRL